MSDDSKDDLSFDNDPGKLDQSENSLDFTFSDIPVLGSEKDNNASFSFDTPEKDPTLASFEALLSEQPKENDALDGTQADDAFSDSEDEFSEDSKAFQSQMEIERVKAIRSAKRRKKKLILFSIVGSAVALVVAVVVLVVVMLKSSHDNAVKKLSPKELAAMRAAKQKEKVDNMMSKAAALYDDGKFPEALTAYRKTLEMDPTRSEAHLGIGKCLENQNKFQEAKQEYEKAIELSPSTAAPFSRLARIHITAGDKQKALNILDNGASKFPDDQDLGLTLANLYFETGDYEKALEHYKRLDTSNLEIQDIKNYASILKDESKEDAKKLLISAARRLKNYSLYSLAAELAKDAGDRLSLFKEALDKIQKGEEHFDDLVFKLAEINKELGDKQAALDNLKKLNVAKLDPKFFAPFFTLLEECDGTPKDVMKQQLDLVRTNAERKADEKLVKEGKLDKAAFNKNFYLPPTFTNKNPSDWQKLVYYLLKKMPDNLDVQLLVLRMINNQTTLNPVDVYSDFTVVLKNNAFYHFINGRIFQGVGNFDAALKRYEKAVELNPKLYPALLAMAKIHLRRRHFKQAKSLLERCVALRPKDSSLRELLCEATILNGESRKALKDYDAFLTSMKTPVGEKTAALADMALLAKTPGKVDGYLAELRNLPNMTLKFKELRAKRNLIFGGAKLSDFKDARNGDFRRCKMIFLLANGEVTKLLQVHTPKEDYPDFWKVFVMLQKKYIVRKKSLASIKAALTDLVEMVKTLRRIGRINRLPKSGDTEAAKARKAVEDAENKAGQSFDAAITAMLAATSSEKALKIAVAASETSTGENEKKARDAVAAAEKAYIEAAKNAADSAVAAAKEFLATAKVILMAAKHTRTRRAVFRDAKNIKIKTAELAKLADAFIAEKESKRPGKKRDILMLLYNKTRGSACIPKKEISAVWNGESCVEDMEELLPVVPAPDLALHYFLLAEEYKYLGQRMKCRIALRKALSAPRSIYRPLIEHAYKQH
jgi:tetratricopeptide (TPR) repeat protein